MKHDFPVFFLVVVCFIVIFCYFRSFFHAGDPVNTALHTALKGPIWQDEAVFAILGEAGCCCRQQQAVVVAGPGAAIAGFRATLCELYR